MPGNNLKLADDFAAFYDNSVVKNNWIGPEVLFENIRDFLKDSLKILDLGIGTGASAILFKQSGHIITGIDGSEKMLECCSEKNIAEKLILHDLEKTPFPLREKSFDVVISQGVFHLIYPLNPVFTEISRILVPGGLLSFTFEDTSETNGYKKLNEGIWETKTDTGVLSYKYSNTYITRRLHKSGFEIIRRFRFPAFENKELQKKFYFTGVLARLKANHS